MSGNQRLISIVERIERLEEEKANISNDIGEIKREAKSAGFDVKVINQMIRERRMDPADRAEHQALLEVYRAALGMLDGTPLGEYARKRFSEQPKPEGEAGSAPDEEAPPETRKEKAKTTPPATPEQIAGARIEGGKAALAGAKISANPWPASDARRAAWDEGWCAEAGSDGMDIPPAFRRSKKKPDGKSEGGSAP